VYAYAKEEKAGKLSEATEISRSHGANPRIQVREMKKRGHRRHRTGNCAEASIIKRIRDSTDIRVPKDA